MTSPARPSAAEQASACARAAEMIERGRVAIALWGWDDATIDDTRAALTAAAVALNWTHAHRDKIACAWGCNKDRKDCR